MIETAPRNLFRANSVAVVLFAASCAAYALSLPMGSLENPGAGMWPFIVSVVMSIAAVSLLVTEREASDYEPLSVRTWIIVAGFGLMALFVVGFMTVGLTLSSFLLCLVWLRWMAHESWKTTVVLSLGFTALYVVTFAILLKVPMPQDILLNLLSGKGF